MARAARRFWVVFLQLQSSFRARSARDRIGYELFETVGGNLVERFVEMPVDVQRGLDRGVSESRLQQFGVGVGRDEERSVGAPRVVEPHGLAAIR